MIFLMKKRRNMKATNKEIVSNIVNEVTDSNMTLKRKMIVLKLLDEAFRKYYGALYLSDNELSENDILFRSM